MQIVSSIIYTSSLHKSERYHLIYQMYIEFVCVRPCQISHTVKFQILFTFYSNFSYFLECA